ncbi:Transcriptional regulator, DeoR family [Devosia sp. H5989]|nr:Transcriptional regulator, DeoR family [Devosia sp. H5989]
MSRTERLLELLQILRRHRNPVPGHALAQELGISMRTFYRDIATLQAQGADIEGEPGMGYVLRPGFTLPPLMFSVEELEALVLGSRWVARRADDPSLGSAAANALAKIAAVLPGELRREVEAATLLVGPRTQPVDLVDARLIRDAIRQEHKLAITYGETARTIWPFAIGFFDHVRIVVAWCELRNDFRHFRTDRITAIKAVDERYPRRRAALLKDWRQTQGIPPDSGP